MSDKELVQAEFCALVAKRLHDVRERVTNSGGDLSKITIVAVTKGHGSEVVVAAKRCGLVDIGENYADELVAKAQSVQLIEGGGFGLRWHFQGRLQTNKINRLRDYANVWQSLDSVERLEALAKRQPGAKVFIQVDSTGGTTGRSGAPIGSVANLVLHGIDRGLDVRGLMTVAPLPEHQCGSPTQAFNAVSELAARLRLPEVSMGMSDDFEDAIRAGSTMIRLGSVLFGPRQ